MPLDVTIPRNAGTVPAYGSRALRQTAILADSPKGREPFLTLGLAAVLIFAVLAFGSFDPWAIAVLEASSAVLFLFWIWPQLDSGGFRLRGNPLYAPAVLFGLLIVVQLVSGLSAYRHATREELWKYIAYGMLLLLASQLHRDCAQRLLTILAAFGSLVAVFALFQYLTYNGKIYWFWPAVPTSFGPYANYNHYAGLMEMLTPISLAMALAECTRRYLQFLWMLGGMLMAATIFICGSRGGMIAFTVLIILLAGFLVARMGRRAVWSLVALCLLTGSLASWMGDARMLKKIDSLREPLNPDVSATRLTIAKDSLRMVPIHPVAGWGLGLFPIVYPQYRSFSTDLLVNQAHNDYLQALVETGILGFGCVVWFIVNLYRSGIQNLRVRSRIAKARVLGPLVGCTGLLVHSFADFNLHIAANAALFFALCGIASAKVDRGYAPEIVFGPYNWERRSKNRL